MALQGTFSGTTANSLIKPTIQWTAVQSVEGNWSEITVVLTYSRTNSGYTTEGNWKGSITIGDRTFTGGRHIQIKQNSNTEAMRATLRVQHNDYGEASVTVSATGGISGTSLSSTKISGTLTLDPIARASGISSSDGTVGGRATVVITRKNDRFTHTVGYTFGSRSGYVGADGSLLDDPVKFTDSVVNMVLPEAFYDQLTNSAQKKCTLTCKTYSGETLIGENTASFTVRTDPRQCAPTLSGRVTEGNVLAAGLTGDSGNYIRYISDAVCTLSAQGRFGATITAKSIAGIPITEDTLTLSGLEQSTILFSCTDSRGYTTQTAVTVSLVPYSLLADRSAICRTDPTSGNAVLTLQGSCWAGNFGEQDNEATAVYQVGQGEPITVPLPIADDGTYQLQLSLADLDYRQSHRIELQIADAAQTVMRVLSVNRGLPVFDWGENDFVFHVPVDLPGLTVDGKPLAEYIRSII